jgi:hypothetical protein
MDASHPGDPPICGSDGEPDQLLRQIGEPIGTSPEERTSGGSQGDGLDLLAERAVPLSQVPRLGIIPVRRRGSRLDIRTVYRWTGAGLSGVRLATMSVGGQRVTTVEALLRFFAAVSEAKDSRRAKKPGGSQTGGKNVDTDLDREGL